MILKPQVYMKIKTLIKAWRKHGALPLLIIQLLTMTTPILYACVMPLWLTIPCGIKQVNDNWYLWYPRQLAFVTMSVFAILAC